MKETGSATIFEGAEVSPSLAASSSHTTGARSSNNGPTAGADFRRNLGTQAKRSPPNLSSQSAIVASHVDAMAEHACEDEKASSAPDDLIVSRPLRGPGAPDDSLEGLNMAVACSSDRAADLVLPESPTRGNFPGSPGPAWSPLPPESRRTMQDVEAGTAPSTVASLAPSVAHGRARSPLLCLQRRASEGPSWESTAASAKHDRPACAESLVHGSPTTDAAASSMSTWSESKAAFEEASPGHYDAVDVASPSTRYHLEQGVPPAPPPAPPAWEVGAQKLPHRSLYEREQSECWEDVPPLTLTASSRSITEPYLPRSPEANAGINFAAAAAAAAMPREQTVDEPERPMSVAMEAQMRELLKGQQRLEMELERAKAEATAKTCELEVLRTGRHTQNGAASRRQTPSTAPHEPIVGSQRFNSSSKFVSAHGNLGYHSNLSTALAVLKRAAGAATSREQAGLSPLPARFAHQQAPRRATGGSAGVGAAARPRGSAVPGQHMSCGLFC